MSKRRNQERRQRRKEVAQLRKPMTDLEAQFLQAMYAADSKEALRLMKAVKAERGETE